LSSGHLTFHLDKLKGLIKVNADSNYELTEDGKEALRLVLAINSADKACADSKKGNRMNSNNLAWVATLIAIVVISGISINGVYGMYIELENDQGKEQLWVQLWMLLDDAEKSLKEATKAADSGDLCGARYGVVVTSTYIDIISQHTMGIEQMGQDYGRFCNEGMQYIWTIQSAPVSVEEAMANGSVTDSQITFLQDFSSALGSLKCGIHHTDGGSFMIDDVNACINHFKALAENAC